MSDWNSGYVTDLGYTYGYYSELAVERVRLAFLNSCHQPPEIKTACELGFGQGISTNINAAATNIEWWGTDFNPSQAAFARDLAASSKLQVNLYDQAFSEFCNRTDLPDFDFIGLHGIWSWISDENRKTITEFIKRKLRPGGVVYISYNTQPGWASMMPVRDLMAECSKTMVPAGFSRTQQIEAALEFTEKLFALKPAYLQSNPDVLDRIKKIKEQNKSYLAHEYFNRDWAPMSFSAVSQYLSSAKLTWGCSAHYLDSIEVLNLTEGQQQLKNSVTDVALQQTLRDFFVNQQFRRDYWIKGPRKLTSHDQIKRLRNSKVLLVRPQGEVELKVQGSLGEALLQDEIYSPLLESLSDHQCKSFSELEGLLAARGINLGQILQAVLVLSSVGAVTPVQKSRDDPRITLTARTLNKTIMELSVSSANLGFLASPVVGGGVPVSRFQQLFLLSIQEGKKKPEEWAQSVWEILTAQGQSIIKEGKTLQGAEENLAELNAQAKIFHDKQLPILKALSIA